MSRVSARAIIINDDKLLVMKRNKFGMEYYTLIGGGVELGEKLEDALRREVLEETGLQLGRCQLVFVEDAGALYGVQNIFWCEYQGGEPALAADSQEASITAMGRNTYEPVWLPIDQLATTTFRSMSVRDAILAAITSGFPTQPRQLAFQA